MRQDDPKDLSFPLLFLWPGLGSFNLEAQVFKTYSPIACFPVMPAAWGWKLYLVRDRQSRSSSVVKPSNTKSRRVEACGLVDEFDSWGICVAIDIDR